MKNASSLSDVNRQKKLDAFDRVLTIMDKLRENCPWDKKQTWDSLRHLTIEELYELSDAVLEGNINGVREELGDMMLHIVFYARIASEEKQFDMADVLNTLSEKLIERHPHIYGEKIFEDEQAVRKNWEQSKLRKGNKSVLQGVPKSLPALVKAIRIQDKVSSIGFDWKSKDQVWEKVREEIEELQNEINPSTKQEKIRDEFGDVLFSLVNYARFINVNPEEALEYANKKFIKRFQHIETESIKEGVKIEEMTLEEMNTRWETAKIKT